jgi:hypothetical protein
MHIKFFNAVDAYFVYLNNHLKSDLVNNYGGRTLFHQDQSNCCQN